MISDSVEKLETFLELIEKANHVLETDVDGLHMEATDLLGPRWTSADDALERADEELGLFADEAKSETAVAIAGADQVKAHARQALEGPADIVVKEAGTGADDLHSRTNSLISALETGAAALETERMTPLAALLEQQQVAFRGFTEEAAEPLEDLLAAVQEAMEQHDVAEQMGIDGLKGATDASARDHQLVASAGALGQVIDSELREDAGGRIAETTQALIEGVGQWVEVLEKEVELRKGQVADLGQATGAHVREEALETSKAVAAAGDALEEVRGEFERMAVTSASAQTEASAVAALAPGIRNAEGEIEELRGLLDVLGTP